MKHISLENLSLLRKILVAFFLISILPLLIAGFYFAYKFLPVYVLIVLGINVALGWVIIIQIFISIGRVVEKVNRQRELIEQKPGTSDEVKVLDEVFDKISLRVKKRFDELKEVSKNTEKLNHEVSKKVALLSTIMQINDLVSNHRDLREIFGFVAERIKKILDIDLCFVMLDDGRKNFVKESLETDKEVTLETISQQEPFLKPMMPDQRMVICNSNEPANKKFKEFVKAGCGVDSLLLAPVVLGSRVAGILGVGKNGDNSAFSEDEKDSIELFAKHLSLLFEHKDMEIKVRDLDTKDALTGLYNDKFMRKRLTERINSAVSSQSPCGFIFIKIKNLKEFVDNYGVLSFEKVMKGFSSVLTDTLESYGEIGRLAEDEIGIIAAGVGKAALEEESKNILSKLKSVLPAGSKVDIGVSIAENPIDGTTAEDLLYKVRRDLSG